MLGGIARAYRLRDMRRNPSFKGILAVLTALPHRGQQGGFSLMEAIVGTLIAVIAILGLAHSFGVGRAMIARYEVARAALGVAQARMEALTVLPLTDPTLAVGTHPVSNFVLQGAVVGTETWRVEWFDDDLSDGPTNDLRRVTVSVAWGNGVDRDSVRVTRLFLK